LYVAGLLGKRMRADDIALTRVQGAQQCGRKTARGTEAGPGRDVGHTGDLDAVVRADELDRGAHNRMSDVAGSLDPLKLGIFDDVTRLKGIVQGDVDIFVDCRGDEKPAMVPVVGGEVGAATAQGDAQRTANNDHPQAPW